MSRTGTKSVATEGPILGSGYRDLTTGALMAGATLYLATIGVDPSGRLRLVKSMSREFELRGRDQIALQTFASFVLKFLVSKAMNGLQFICSPPAGGHMACASSYKVEAALQLLLPRVRLIPSASITLYAHSADVPGPDRGRLGAARAKLQQRAIVAAVYGSAERLPVSSSALLAPGLIEEEPQASTKELPGDHQTATADSTPAASAESTAMRQESKAGEMPDRSLEHFAETADSRSFAERTSALIASI